MIYEIILIALGFAILIKSADILIDGACSIAKRFNVPDIVVGLTIVALGTSAPELVVSMISTIKGSGGIAIGNVMGSNIANICLVLGAAGIIAPIAVGKKSVKQDLPFCLGTGVLLLLLVVFFNQSALISRIEGGVLMACLLIYMSFMFTHSKDIPVEEEVDDKYKIPFASFLILAGCGGLVLGGDVTVKNCVSIARNFGVSEEMIGLTIVALGTSLPELATSIMSVIKGKTDIALGNVVGSNIMNTCLVLGSVALVRPIDSDTSFTMDASLVVVASLMLIIFMFTGKKRQLDRWEAGILLASYISYIVFVIKRG